MTTRIAIAADCFLQGFNCAQAVFSTYAPFLGMEQDDALRATTGMGAGMGRLQEVCGAVTGAFMVIGCANGVTDAAESSRKENAYSLIQEFEKGFRQSHGSILCRDLLHCNLRTEEGMQEYEENDLLQNVCLACVRDACKIVEEIVFKEATVDEA